MTRLKRATASYSVHPSVAMKQAWIAGLQSKTGRDLEEWIELVQEDGPESEGERRAWLKSEHGMGTNGAWWIAELAEGRAGVDGDPTAYLKAADGYVASMFSGKTSALRPICDKLLDLGRALGDDVRVCPCKTVVPIYRRHVIAEIKPVGGDRIDFGFALRDLEPTGRLVETGGFAKQDRISHVVPIRTLSDVNAEVKRWLRWAYDLDA